VTRRTALFFAVAAVIGVGAAAAVIASRKDAPAHPAAAAAAANAKPSLASNQIRLSRAESVRLVDWASRFRSCMARRGVKLAAPVAHEKEIDLVIVRAPARAVLMRSVPICGDALGEPPRRSSLQVRPGKLILYLPRRCLLDKKVARPLAQ
jgi:hypothetical protein